MSSSDVSSSSFFEDVPSSPPVESSSPIDSSPKQLVRRSHCLHMPPDCYSPLDFTTTALSDTTSYHYAILHPEWQHAMAEEIASLEQTGTRNLVPCPPRVHLITCNWVYKAKTRFDGSLEHYKVRIVACGFQQEQGQNYDETFALVAQMATIRTLLVMAFVREWTTSQLDVKNAFLNGELREDVYIHPLPGYSISEGMD
jgi:hypothetical protein